MVELMTKPMTRRRRPCYPTWTEVQCHPDLLRKHVPPAWLARAELTGALGVCLAATGTGCTGEASSTPAAAMVPTMPDDVSLVLSGMPDKDEEALASPAGKYRSFGGYGVGRPTVVILTEEEAIAFIKEELGKHGLDMPESDFLMDSVCLQGWIRPVQHDWLTERVKFSDAKLVVRPLSVDLREPRLGIGVEYVSCDWNTMRSRRRPGELVYDAPSSLEAAEAVAKEIRKHGTGIHVGVFHDPFTKLDRKLRRALGGDELDRARTRSRRLLRLQVKSFVEWLQGQGVI